MKLLLCTKADERSLLHTHASLVQKNCFAWANSSKWKNLASQLVHMRLCFGTTRLCNLISRPGHCQLVFQPCIFSSCSTVRSAKNWTENR